MNNKDLAEIIFKRQLIINRLESDIVKFSDQNIIKLKTELKPFIMDLDLPGIIDSQKRLTQVNKTFREISPLLSRTFTNIEKYSFNNFEEFKYMEGRYLMNSFNQPDYMLNNRDLENFTSSINEKKLLVSGYTTQDLFRNATNQSIQNFDRLIKQGATFSLTNNQIFRTMFGGTENGVSVPGIIPSIKNKFNTAIRTSFVRLTNTVRDGVYFLHPFIEGKQQVSIMDSRTSTTCMKYHRKAWTTTNKPIGHTLPFKGGPPRHPNCRSTIIPIRDKSQIEDFDFEDWFKNQSEDFQNKSIGKTKANMFRRGKIKINDLVDQSGNVLTIEQLRELDK